MRRNAIIRLAESVAVIARPAAMRRIVHDVSLRRGQFDVAHAGKQICVGMDHAAICAVVTDMPVRAYLALTSLNAFTMLFPLPPPISMRESNPLIVCKQYHRFKKCHKFLSIHVITRGPSSDGQWQFAKLKDFGEYDD